MTQKHIRQATHCFITIATVLWWWAMLGVSIDWAQLSGLLVMMVVLVLYVDGTPRQKATPRRMPEEDLRPSQLRACLKRRVGLETFTSWFNALEVESFDGTTVKVSLPVRFLRDYVQTHYLADLTYCACQVYEGSICVLVMTRPLPVEMRQA